MVAKETMTRNEVENDGRTIFLYYSPELGLYVAYGFSAFFASHIVEVIESFSEALLMPVALLRKGDIEPLLLSAVSHEKDEQQNYRLELRIPIAMDDYYRWANSLKE